MSKHEQKIAWIEGPPAGWPDGWKFGPGCPLPPGWGSRDYGDTVLAVLSTGGRITLLEVYTLDKFSEDTDVLEGQLFSVKCFDNGRPIRMKLTKDHAMPWTEQLMLKCREYEPGKWGILENVEIDEQRVVGESPSFLVSVWGSQPVLDVEVSV